MQVRDANKFAESLTAETHVFSLLCSEVVQGERKDNASATLPPQLRDYSDMFDVSNFAQLPQPSAKHPIELPEGK